MVRIAAAAAVAAVAWVHAATALEPEQFAFGWPFELPAGDGVFDVPLAPEVYASAASIEELAVLDANGDPMPFYRVSVPQSVAEERRVPLAVSPVYVGADDRPIAEVSVATGDTRTNVTVVPPAEARGTEIAAFVVDARTVSGAPFAFELEWRPGPQPFLLDVLIEQSAALMRWRPVGRAQIAALEIGVADVRHGRVAVAAAEGGYYRIAPTSLPASRSTGRGGASSTECCSTTSSSKASASQRPP